MQLNVKTANCRAMLAKAPALHLKAYQK